MDHARRHLLEQHSMLGYMCPVCQRTFNRPNASHEGCRNGVKPNNLILYCRQTGKQGMEATALLDDFRRRIPSLVEKVNEELPPHQPSRGPMQGAPSAKRARHDDLQDILEDLPDELAFLVNGDTEAVSQYVSVPESPRTCEAATLKTTDVTGDDGRIILDIGGTKFTTSRATLNMVSGCFFTDMLLPSITNYFVDRDPLHFRTILNFLRYGGNIRPVLLPDTVKELVELEIESEYYRLYNLGVRIREKLEMLH